jgi:hypothetical protein
VQTSTDELATSTCQTLEHNNNNFTIEMKQAKPKMLKNFNSLYQIFMPSRKSKKRGSTIVISEQEKNKSMDYINPSYYVTFN